MDLVAPRRSCWCTRSKQSLVRLTQDRRRIIGVGSSAVHQHLRAVALLLVALVEQTSFPEMGFGVLVDGFSFRAAFATIRPRDVPCSASYAYWRRGETTGRPPRRRERRRPHDGHDEPFRHRNRNLLSRQASSSASSSPLSSSSSSRFFEYDWSLLRSFLSELDRSLGVTRSPEAPTAAASKTTATTKEFRSFVIALEAGKKGARAPKKASNSTAAGAFQPLPGSLKKITGRLVRLPTKRKSKSKSMRTQREDRISDEGATLDATMMMHVTFKYHGATDIAKNWPVDDVSTNLEQVVRWLSQKSSVDGAVPSIVKSIATEWSTDNLNPLPGSRGSILGRIETSTRRWDLKLALARENAERTAEAAPARSSSLQSRSLSAERNKSESSDVAMTPMSVEHDRRKRVPVSISEGYWQALGVTDAAGRLKPDMTSKFRQCQKFVEIVSQLVGSSWNRPVQLLSTADIRAIGAGPIHVTDMGCGRGYLTFALHSHLQQLAKGTTASPSTIPSRVETVGVDVRPKLVAELNQIVTTLNMTGLRFEPGSIQDYVANSNLQFIPRPLNGWEGNMTRQDDVDRADTPFQILIALHACDTATDDALYAAIHRRVDVVVTAPCCHKQLRPQIDQLMTTSEAHPLSDVLRHGIYRERTGETVTDSLRALLLELAGYKTKVFEFVGGEHTAKNCMITGVLKRDANNRSPIHQNAKEQDLIRRRIGSLALFYGIRQHKLAELMGEQSLLVHQQSKISAVPLTCSIFGMPPL